jgi:hypothetical protein
MSKEEKEKLDDVSEETDGSDRRDFLKTAGKAAGAVALASAIGTLMRDEAAASEPFIGQRQRRMEVVSNLKLNVAKDTSRKQFGLSGPELGQVLKNEGFIPGNVTNLGNAALHVSVSW